MRWSASDGMRRGVRVGVCSSGPVCSRCFGALPLLDGGPDGEAGDELFSATHRSHGPCAHRRGARAQLLRRRSRPPLPRSAAALCCPPWPLLTPPAHGATGAGRVACGGRGGAGGPALSRGVAGWLRGGVVGPPGVGLASMAGVSRGAPYAPAECALRRWARHDPVYSGVCGLSTPLPQHSHNTLQHTMPLCGSSNKTSTSDNLRDAAPPFGAVSTRAGEMLPRPGCNTHGVACAPPAGPMPPSLYVY